MGWDDFKPDMIAEEKAQIILQANHPDSIVLKTEAERKDMGLNWYDMKTKDSRTIEAKFDSHVLDDQTSRSRFTGNTFMEFFSQSGIIGGLFKAFMDNVDIFIYKFMFEDKSNVSWKEGSNHDLELIMDTKKLFYRVLKGVFIQGHRISKNPETSYGVLTPIDYIRDLQDTSLLEPPVLIRTIRK